MRYRLFTTVIVLVLAACGGSAQRDKTTPPASALTPGAPTQKQVNYVIDSRGCLQGNNADNEVNFFLGDKPAKYLSWACATHLTHDLRQIRVLFAFDYTQNCFTERLTAMDFARCTAPPPTIPTNPVVAIGVAGFALTPATNAQGLPGFNCLTTINNTGNIPALDVSYQFRIAGGSPFTSGKLNVVEAQSSMTIEHCGSFGAALAGQSVTLELELTDVYGQPFLARPATATVTIP